MQYFPCCYFQPVPPPSTLDSGHDRTSVSPWWSSLSLIVAASVLPATFFLAALFPLPATISLRFCSAFNCAPTPLLAWQQDHRGCWGKDYGRGKRLGSLHFWTSTCCTSLQKKKLRSTDQLAMTSSLFIVCKIIKFFLSFQRVPLKKRPSFWALPKQLLLVMCACIILARRV